MKEWKRKSPSFNLTFITKQTNNLSKFFTVSSIILRGWAWPALLLNTCCVCLYNCLTIPVRFPLNLCTLMRVHSSLHLHWSSGRIRIVIPPAVRFSRLPPWAAAQVDAALSRSTAQSMGWDAAVSAAVQRSLNCLPASSLQREQTFTAAVKAARPPHYPRDSPSGRSNVTNSGIFIINLKSRLRELLRVANPKVTFKTELRGG